MDPLTHTLVGLCLGQGGWSDRSRFGTTALVLGANLPDVDALSYLLVDSDTSLWIRRGWTHGIPALVVWPFILVGVFWLWNRKFPRTGVGPGPAFDGSRLLWMSAVAIWSHPVLDWLNNYGMRWWMPFDGTWYYGDAVFILDPWMWLVLGAAVGFGSMVSGSARALISLLAFLALGLVWLAVPGRLPWKALWTVLCLAAAIAIRHGSRDPVGRRPARVALATFVGYVSAMLWVGHASEHSARALALAQGIAVERILVGPTPISPTFKDVVIETATHYRFGTWRLDFPFTEPVLVLAAHAIPRLDENAAPSTRRAWQSPSIRGFRNWARFPAVVVDRAGEQPMFRFFDVRYVRDGFSEGRGGFGSASVPTESEPTSP